MPPSEKWCENCHPDLPLHKHQNCGSCLVKSTKGNVVKFNLMCRRSNGKVVTISAADLCHLSKEEMLVTADASELFALSKHDVKAMNFLKGQLCSAGLVQCGTCVPSCPPLSEDKDPARETHSKLPLHRHEDGSGMEQKPEVEEELKKFKFSSLGSESKDWCKNCHPNLPPHKHQEDGSCLVKSTDGLEEFRELSVDVGGGTEVTLPASAIFPGNTARCSLGNILPCPMVNLSMLIRCATVAVQLHSIEESFNSSLMSSAGKTSSKPPFLPSSERGNDENWDLDEALEFIEGGKGDPPTTKKAKKKKKKLTEKSDAEMKKKSNHSEDDILKSDHEEGPFKHESELVVETTGGMRSPLGASLSESRRPEPSVQSCPPPIKTTGHVGESDTPKNLRSKYEKGPGKGEGDKRCLKDKLVAQEKLLEDVLLKVVGFEESEGGEESHEKEKLGSVATGFLQAMVEDCVKTTLEGRVEKLLEQNDALKKENKRMKDAMERIEIQVEVADQEVTTAMKELEKRGSQISKLSAENQKMHSEKKKMKTQMELEQNRVVAAEKELKAKEHKINQLMRQNESLVVEKTWMKTQLVKAENQLERLQANLLLEESCRAAAEEKLKRAEEQIRFEQAERKAVEEELADLKHREEELRNSVRQMMSVGQQVMSVGESILKAGSKHQIAEQNKDVEIRNQGKQVGDVETFPSSGNSASHSRLVEKLLKRIKQPPISPADCSRFVQKLRSTQNGLSGLPMEVIEEEVRRMAMEEAEVKAKECPICFDPMVSKLLYCKQCNQGFHNRCWNDWAQSKELHSNAAECPVCRTANQK